MPLRETGPPEHRPGTAGTGDENHPRRSRVGLVLGFALAGILVVLYASRTDPVLQIPLTAQFGLLQELPLLYWFGLGLLALSLLMAARGNSDLLFVVAGAAFLGILAVTAALFEPNPPVWDSYIHFATSENIARIGRLPTDPSQYAANWPGFFLVLAVAHLMGGLPPLQLIGLFPFFSGIITFVALFVFLRSFFSTQIARAASVLSSLLNVWAQFHVSPQGVGLALALLVLATAWDRRVPVRVANAILFLGLLTSHATSTFFLLGILGLDFVFAQFLLRRASTKATRRTLFGAGASPFLAYVTAWLGWLFFVASGSASLAKTAVASQIGNILQVGEATANVVAARSVANIYVWPPRLRIAALGIFGLVSLIALIVLFLKKPTRNHGRFFVAAFIALGVLGAADILFFGGQFYDRAFMFFAVLAPGLCLFGFRQFHVRPSVWRAVFIVLLVGGIAAAATNNYQEAFYFVPSQSVAVSEFLSSHGNSVLALDGIFPQPVRLLTHAATPWDDVPFYTVYPVPLISYNRTTPALAVFDKTAMLWYVQGHGIEIYQYYEAQQAQFSQVYDNGYAQVYLLNGAVPGR